MSPELSANEPGPRPGERIIIEKLNEVLALLERIETRQKRTTKLVEEVESQEQRQVTGSFGSSEI